MKNSSPIAQRLLLAGLAALGLSGCYTAAVVTPGPGTGAVVYGYSTPGFVAYGDPGYYHGVYGASTWGGRSGYAWDARGGSASWSNGSGSATGWRGSTAHWDNGSGSINTFRGGSASWGGGSGSWHGAGGRSGSWHR